jgi:hypothetical protein
MAKLVLMWKTKFGQKEIIIIFASVLPVRGSTIKRQAMFIRRTGMFKLLTGALGILPYWFTRAA